MRDARILYTMIYLRKCNDNDQIPDKLWVSMDNSTVGLDYNDGELHNGGVERVERGKGEREEEVERKR